jgi:hypothetical protein
MVRGVVVDDRVSVWGCRAVRCVFPLLGHLLCDSGLDNAVFGVFDFSL